MRVVFLLLFGILLFVHCSPEKENERSLLQFIPQNASVVVKINDFNTFKNELNDNDLVQKLGDLDISKKISSTLASLSYVQTSREALLSLTKDSLQGIDFTFVTLDTISYINLSEVTDKTVETLKYEAYNIKKYSVKGHEFYTAKIKNNEVLSSCLKLLKNLISKDYTDADAQFAKFYALSDPTKLGQLWLNMKHSDLLFKELTNSKGKLLPSNFSDWIYLDVSLENESLFLNGFSTTKDSTDNYIDLFSGTKPLANATYTMLPKDSELFTSSTFDSYNMFYKNQVRYLNRTTMADSLFSTIEEIGTAQIEKQQVVLLKTFGTDQITDYLQRIRKSSIEFQGGEIWELEAPSFIENSLDPLVSDFKSNYVCILENTLVFAEEQQALEKVILAYKNGNTITETPFFENLEELTTRESTVLATANAEGLLDVLTAYGLQETAEQFKTLKLSDYVFGSEIISETDFYHTSFFIQKIGEKSLKNSVSTVFKIQLEKDISSVPQFVTNHQTKKGELIVQDTDNMLYLISTKGKTLWSKQLESRIQGKVQQVDLFKNGKLQFAFTTNNQFLVLDRNGELVKPFSFDFTGGNLNPLAVFDYDGKKEYRFVVTQGDKVFMYDKNGKIVKGFTYTSAEKNILDAPQHFRIGNKDYLIFRLADNTVKILNRVGNVRIKGVEKISFSDNPARLYENKITLTSNSGELIQINANGTIEKTNLELNNDHGMDASSKTLAIINDNILRIREKKVILELGVYSKPTVFYLNDKIYVSVTDIQNQKIYLFDSQAQAVPNFPVYGISVIDMADIENDKKPELVIQDQENSFSVIKIN